jgi:release factor glutamine methyltransferase
LIQARANLRRLQLQQRVEVIEGSWWEPLHRFRGHLDLVVSNPPYIPTATWKELEPIVLRHEPELALHAGEDGLAAIRAIAAEAGQQLAPGGWLLLEHHHDQSAAVLQLLETAGLERVTARRDLEGHERFALARRPR